jgi:predicted lipoprotein with Yx(FWY)xxD motif
MKRRTTFILASLAVIGAVVIAGCGGGGSSSSSSGSTAESGGETASATTGGSGGSGTIAGTEVSGLGTVLADSGGMTVYEFTEDSGTTSNCYGECEAAWPPVTASGKPTAGTGAMSADLGMTKRKDGTLQVTYKGHPLYTFSGDSAPGEANGQELDGTWFALDEAGSPVEGKATAAASGAEAEPAAEESEESSGGYGY